MKKIFSLLACLFACFLVVGCSFIEDIVGEDDDDENKYVWEYGYIDSSEKVYDCYTFEQVKSVRDNLRGKSHNYHSPSNISEARLRNYFQDNTDMTADRIESVIRNLNEVGNTILYFNYKGNQPVTKWHYIEKR